MYTLTKGSVWRERVRLVLQMEGSAAEGAATEGEEGEGHADYSHAEDGSQTFEQGLGVPADHQQGAEGFEEVSDWVEGSDCRQPAGHGLPGEECCSQEGEGEEQEEGGVDRGGIAGLERYGVGEASVDEAPGARNQYEDDHPQHAAFKADAYGETEDDDGYGERNDKGEIGDHEAEEHGEPIDGGQGEAVEIAGLDIDD